MHRGPREGRSRHRQHDSRRSLLIEHPADPPPADLMPYRARVTVREVPARPARRPGPWIGGYRVHVLDVIAVVFGTAVLVAIFSRSFVAVAVIFTAGIIAAIVWPS